MKPVQFAFILLPQFTLTAFSGMLDVLRLASDEGDRSRQVRCSWRVIDETSTPVYSSSGIQVMPTEELGDPVRFDYVVVVGGLLHPDPSVNEAQLDFIQKAAKKNVTLVGLCTGVFALMQAGVLHNHRVCISWFHYWDYLERFPFFPTENIVADRLYVVDRQRITCSGGRASIDVAAEILKRHIDDAIIQKALRILLVDSADRANAAQPLPPGIQPSSHPIARRAILLMEQNIGRSLSLEELAGKLNISIRHLERLFKQSTGVGPQAYGRGLRLRMAAWMLAHSMRTISSIAAACGFSDASHFGRDFRSAYGESPSSWRKKNQMRDLATHESTNALDYVSEVYPNRQEFF